MIAVDNNTLSIQDLTIAIKAFDEIKHIQSWTEARKILNQNSLEKACIEVIATIWNILSEREPKVLFYELIFHRTSEILIEHLMSYNLQDKKAAQ